MTPLVRIRRASSAGARVTRLLARLKRDLDRRSLEARPAPKPEKVKR